MKETSGFIIQNVHQWLAMLLIGATTFTLKHHDISEMASVY